MRTLKKYLFLFFSLILIGASAQEIQLKKGDFLYGLGAGVNYSNLFRNNEVNNRGLPRPFIGLSSTYIFSKKLGLNGDFLFSPKASQLDNGYVYNQQGFDIQLALRYSIDDIHFNFGLSNSFGFNRSLRKKSGSANEEGIEIEDLGIPSFYLNPSFGMEFKLMDNWTMKANYIAPIIDEDIANLQIGLTYRINKKYPRKESDRRKKRRIAENQIRELRDGALLVRLKTSKPKIEALRKLGYFQEAQEVEKEQRIENLMLMKSFNNYYDFSEVKFFYSEDSRKIRERNYAGVFLNDSLKKDRSIQLYNSQNIFIAELANLEKDTTKYFSHYELVSTGDFAQVQVPRYYGGSDISFYAIVIKDENFYQLSKPFPYYSRALFKGMKENEGHGIFYLPLRFFFHSTPKETFQNLNEKLHRFYQKTVY